MPDDAPGPSLCLLLSCAVLLCAPGRAELVSAWKFDADPPGIAVDSGPAKLDGLVRQAEYVPGVAGEGQALRFGRDDAVVEFPASQAIAFESAESFAVSFWARTRQANGFATLLMTKDRPGGAVSYSFCLGREPGRISFEVWSWTGTKLVSRKPITDGDWHYVRGVHDARTNTAYLLVDDEVQAAMPAGQGGPHEVILRLGNNVDAPQPYKGDLDDVTIESGIPDDLAPTLELVQSWQLLTSDQVRAWQQAYLDRMAAPKFHHAASAEDWKAHAAMVREHVLDCLGLWPLPERLPLDVHVSGVIEHDGYVLKRVYWQTWPKYYASGYLYMPKSAKLPAPGILCPHGHWENGARNPVVQARCISLAMKGYVVLAVDSVHTYNWAAGLGPLTAMMWNDMRGVDLLCSLPEVDPTRLGCTGCSGGGQQTFYMMAIDDRLSVAIPVCMVSEWRTILSIDSHHCTCNHAPGILRKTDTPELAACFAPKPSLMICVTGDWTASYPQHGFPETKRVYEMFQAGDKVKCTQYDWHHDYSLPMREEAYGYFNRYLMGITDPEQAKEPAHTPETLEALAKLDGPPEGALPAESIAADILRRRGFDASPLAGDVAARLAAIREGFVTLTNEVEVRDSAAVTPVGEPKDVQGCRVERLVLTSEQEVPLPTVIVSGGGEEPTRKPAVILLNGEGKAGLLSTRWSLVQALAERGAVVCIPDVRPYGELGANRAPQQMNGIVFGRPELAVAAHDAKRVAQYLRSRLDVDPQQVMCVGLGEAAVVALAAGIYDPALERIAALELGDTYSASDRLPRCPRILTVADLPQLAGALAPRALWVQGARQPEAFGWTAQAYEGTHAAANLLITQPEVDEADLVAWLTAG